MATVGEDEHEAAATAKGTIAAAEDGAAAPAAGANGGVEGKGVGAGSSEDEGPKEDGGQSGGDGERSAALDIPFTPITLVFKCARKAGEAPCRCPAADAELLCCCCCCCHARLPRAYRPQAQLC